MVRESVNFNFASSISLFYFFFHLSFSACDFIVFISSFVSLSQFYFIKKKLFVNTKS